MDMLEAEDNSLVLLIGSPYNNQAAEWLLFPIVLAKKVYNPQREKNFFLVLDSVKLGFRLFSEDVQLMNKENASVNIAKVLH